MITRRTTQIVAWSTMPRSVTPLRPKAWPEGALAKRGWGRGGRRDREIIYHLGARIPLRVAPSYGRHCSALRGRARFYRNPNGTRLCDRTTLSGSSRRGYTIPFVAFRAFHPAKPPSRSRGFVQRFPRPWGLHLALCWRLRTKHMPANPSAMRASETGSGTGLTSAAPPPPDPPFPP